MHFRYIVFILITLSAFLIYGCSGGAGSVAPDITGESQLGGAASESPHQLWGLWNISVNKEHSAFEVEPVRLADIHFNVVHLLEYSPCVNCLSIAKIKPSGLGYLEVTVELRHPYPGVDTFTGFDVRGIAMFNASKLFPSTGLTYSAAYLGDAELLNPDGYTTLYNFLTEGHGMQGYLQGKLATIPPVNGTLNGYKNFYTDENRRYFDSGDAIQVVYNIDPPAGAFKFGYAVDASWAAPTPFNNPTVPDDFPPNANSSEAYDISVSVTDLTAGLDDVGVITVDIWDHQGLDTIDTVFVEVPNLFDGTITVPFSEDMSEYFRYSGDITNSLGGPMGDYVSLVGVRDTTDENSPEWMEFIAYNIFNIHVEPKEVPPGIFVDGDYPGNAGGLPEFGTPEEPFNTIIEGVIAAIAGDDVYVDPLQDDERYMEEIQLKDGLRLHGLNWNDDGDSGKPIVQGPDDAQQTMYGMDVDDVLIEGFELHIPDNIMEEFLYVIFLDSDFGPHASGCTIRDNYFTGYIDNPGGEAGDEWELIKAYYTDDLLIEENLFADCHVTSEQGGFLAAMWLTTCENPIIRYNRIINNESRNSFVGIIADYADYITIHNNEVGNWHRLGTSYVNINWAINIVSDCLNCQIYQNEIHDLDPNPGYATTAGIFIRTYGQVTGDWEINNNLIYNTHSSLGYENETFYNRNIFFRLDSNDIHIGKLEINNNTLYNSTSGFYNSGVHLEKNSGAVIDELRIYNNLVVKQVGPVDMYPDEPTAAYRIDYSTVSQKIDFCLAYDLSHLTFAGFEEGVGFLDGVDPEFTNPSANDFSFPPASPAEQGSPYIVDWDDTGIPSEDPDDTDINTRSRMGCFGGPMGDWTPPSQQ